MKTCWLVKILLIMTGAHMSLSLVGENFNEQEAVATLFNPAAKVGRKVLILKDNKIASFPYVNLPENWGISCDPSLVSFGVFSSANVSPQTIIVRTDHPKIVAIHSQLLTSIVRNTGIKTFEVQITPNFSALQKGSVIKETVLINSSKQVEPNKQGCLVNVAGIFN